MITNEDLSPSYSFAVAGLICPHLLSRRLVLRRKQQKNKFVSSKNNLLHSVVISKGYDIRSSPRVIDNDGWDALLDRFCHCHYCIWTTFQAKHNNRNTDFTWNQNIGLNVGILHGHYYSFHKGHVLVFFVKILRFFISLLLGEFKKTNLPFMKVVCVNRP